MHKAGLMLAALAATLGAALAQAAPPVVLAAASLQESLTAAAAAWAAQRHDKPVISFAGSSALAKQIAAGAPADIFISADEPWMDDVQKKGLIVDATRVSFLQNKLVLIAPASSTVALDIKPGFDLPGALNGGRLAMADPASVPAGKYGKAALLKLGVWMNVGAHVASAENVRAAMALVERGEAPLGIVYATDALASKKVRVVATFPADSHPPITYPIAVLKSASSKDSRGFEHFLLSPAGKAIFKGYGFTAR